MEVEVESLQVGERNLVIKELNLVLEKGCLVEKKWSSVEEEEEMTTPMTMRRRTGKKAVKMRLEGGKGMSVQFAEE